MSLVVSGARGGSAADLILPGALGHRRNAGGLTIHVPRGYEAEPRRIVGICRVCGATFRERGEEAAWQRHVGPCARRELDRLRAEGPQERNRGTVFDPEFWDPELQAHMNEVGKRMLEEGRMTLKPHERADG